MDGGLSLRLIHVAGSHMIKQGTDGGSRGDLNQGMMDGKPMLKHVFLHLLALKRSSLLETWVWSWRNNEHGELVTTHPGAIRLV